jgi:hypothetical protein
LRPRPDGGGPLRQGDVVDVEIDGGIGVLCNPIIAES